MSDFRNPLEEYVVEELKDVDPDTRKTPGSGCGASIGDVSNKYFFIECLSGDTLITKHSGGSKSKRISIKEIYNYLTDPSLSGRGYSTSKYKNKQGQITEYKYLEKKSWWQKTHLPSIYCLDTNTDKITINRMKNIIYSGKKQVFQLETRLGFQIKATENHLFFSSKGWVPLKSLKLNECVAVKNWEEYRYQKRGYNRKIINLFNKMKYNNCLSNLKVLSFKCQSKIPKKRKKYIYENYEFDKIVSINKLNKEDCYDIEMEGDDNVANFIANEFIVHNCKQKHTKENIIVEYRKEYLDLVGQLPLSTKKVVLIVTENKFGDKFVTLDSADFFNLVREAKL